MASVIPSTLFDTREIAAVLPFGAVLAGRLLARPLIRARLTPVLAGVLALYAVALGYGVSQPQASNTEQALVGWLEAHHLSTGLGTYTEDNVTTLDSGGRVQMLTRVVAAERRRSARIPVNGILVRPAHALRRFRLD